MAGRLKKDNSEKNFYMKFYIDRFFSDERLRDCEASSVGVYIYTICLLFKSDNQGKYMIPENLKQKHKSFLHDILLMQNDMQTYKQKLSICMTLCMHFCMDFACVLHRYLPYQDEVIAKGLYDLLLNKVLLLDEDSLYQKKMVSDSLLSISRSKSGKNGAKKREFNKSKNNNNIDILHDDLLMQNDKQNVTITISNNNSSNNEYSNNKENTHYDDDERKESAERKTTKPEFENAVKNFVNATANESESLNKHLKFDEVIVEDFCENWLTSNEFSNQREQLMIKHYIQTPENLKDWIYAFNRHLLIHGDNFTHDGKVIKTKRDYAKHFSNWMDKTKRGDVNPNELNIAKKPQAQKPKTNLAGIPIHDSGLVDGNELLKNLIDKGVVKRGR